MSQQHGHPPEYSYVFWNDNECAQAVTPIEMDLCPFDVIELAVPLLIRVYSDTLLGFSFQLQFSTLQSYISRGTKPIIKHIKKSAPVITNP